VKLASKNLSNVYSLHVSLSVCPVTANHTAQHMPSNYYNYYYYYSGLA